MSKHHQAYPPEFRQQMVDLVRAGRTPEELAREFEPSAQAIRNWVARPIATRVGALTARPRRSARSLRGCVGRTAS
jgi:transposase